MHVETTASIATAVTLVTQKNSIAIFTTPPPTTLELTPKVITASSNSIHHSIATSIFASTTKSTAVTKFITTAVLPSLKLSPPAQQPLPTLAVPLHTYIIYVASQVNS
jgi:hypothetical protein